jgi:hypothetical protein
MQSPRPMAALRRRDWAGRGDGIVTVVGEGEKNTGIDEYTFNIQSNYTFSRGRLKGFGVFAGLRTFYNNRAYYTQVFSTSTTGTALQATRVLYRLPRSTVVDFNVNYRRKLGEKYTWSSQLNVSNVFDNSEVNVVPSVVNAAVLNARLTNQPRRFMWTNTFSF